MKIMEDCHDLSLKCEVLLLGDVFEFIKNSSLKSYGLFPSHYLNEPVCDTMLNTTKVEIELKTDLYLFFQEGLRGICFHFFKRYSEYSNKYLEYYNPRHIYNQNIWKCYF